MVVKPFAFAAAIMVNEKGLTPVCLIKNVQQIVAVKIKYKPR